MYFIVYLVEPKVHVVIPTYWIFGAHDKLWDKFVNSGVNSSQKYLCYWLSENNSIEFLGAPNDRQPDFTAKRVSHFPCSEGTYVCRIVKFRGST